MKKYQKYFLHKCFVLIKKQIMRDMHLSNEALLPIFFIADTFNRVVFISQGYTIGLGEQLNNVAVKIGK